MTTKITLAPRLKAFRDDLQTRRDARTARAALERELSSYRTTTELDEWDAILARHDDSDTAAIRQILDRNRHRVA